MILLTVFVSNVLLYLSVLHIYWAFGGLWPGKTKQELIDMVFGKGETFPSRFACLFVSTSLLFFTLLPFVWTFRTDLMLSEDKVFSLKLILYLISLIFLLRGFLGYLPFVTKMWKPIFNYYTKRIYNPLCIFLGISLIFLLVKG